MPPTYIHHSPSTSYQEYTATLPRYTEHPKSCEMVLSSTLSTARAGREHRQYVYKMDSIEIVLEDCPWGLLYAAYGCGGTVKGVVSFVRKCPSVREVTIKLEGTVKTTTSEYSMVGVTKHTIFDNTTTLFYGSSGSTVPVCARMPFTLSFPARTDDNAALPPSSYAYHPGITAETVYSIQVDVVRGKFYRHERCSIPVLYLPKSCPVSPPLSSIPFGSPGQDLPSGVRTVNVAPRCDGASTSSIAMDLSVQLFMPNPAVFASGAVIPLGLLITCSHSPAISELLSGGICMYLMKKSKVWIKQSSQPSIREQSVSEISKLQKCTLHEGMVYMTTSLRAGGQGGGCSWGIEGVMAVEYCIQVVVCPPKYANHLLTFQHEEVVQLCTDAFGTVDRELLMMDGVPTPALGMSGFSGAS